jgi:iron complex transport system substrate-binding protein
MVELAGGKDCLGKRGETSTRLETEALEAYAPEVVLLLPCGFAHPRTRAEWETIRHQSVWKNLPAVRERKVFVVDGSLFHRPGPRLVDGVELVAHLLHPELRIAACSQAFLQQVG